RLENILCASFTAYVFNVNRDVFVNGNIRHFIITASTCSSIYNVFPKKVDYGLSLTKYFDVSKQTD
ncbi:MAG TPA: hypothetical protein VHF28_01940, partial [Nitrososphaera sp.]|nr:hypothetical protein [Nitrososphaera sp.]